MANTFNRPRTQYFCKGYLYTLEDIEKRFEESCAHNTVLSCANKEIAFEEEQSTRWSKAPQIFEKQGCAQAWADLAAFCAEAQIGWNRDLFVSWLVLRRKVVEAHWEAQWLESWLGK